MLFDYYSCEVFEGQEGAGKPLNDIRRFIGESQPDGVIVDDAIPFPQDEVLVWLIRLETWDNVSVHVWEGNTDNLRRFEQEHRNIIFITFLSNKDEKHESNEPKFLYLHPELKPAKSFRSVNPKGVYLVYEYSDLTYSL